MYKLIALLTLLTGISASVSCIALRILDTGLKVMEVHRISMVYRFIGRLSASTREGDEAPLPPFNPPSTPQKWGWVSGVGDGRGITRPPGRMTVSPGGPATASCNHVVG